MQLPVGVVTPHAAAPVVPTHPRGSGRQSATHCARTGPGNRERIAPAGARRFARAASCGTSSAGVPRRATCGRASRTRPGAEVQTPDRGIRNRAGGRAVVALPGESLRSRAPSSPCSLRCRCRIPGARRAYHLARTIDYVFLGPRSRTPVRAGFLPMTAQLASTPAHFFHNRMSTVLRPRDTKRYRSHEDG